MTNRKQNLILIFQDKNIGAQKVKSYMNWFCVNEEDQTEIDWILKKHLAEPDPEIVCIGSMESKPTEIIDLHVIIEASGWRFTKTRTLYNEETEELFSKVISDLIHNLRSSQNQEFKTVDLYNEIYIWRSI